MSLLALHVSVLAFGRVREIIGTGESRIDIEPGASVEDVWDLFAERFPGLRPLAATTRIARNGSIVDRSFRVSDGDELAFLPPVGGG